MSIVVIGVNHRTGPLALLERVAVRSRRLPQGHRRSGRPRQRPRGRRAQHVQPHRGVRRRRAVPRRLRRHPRLLLRARRPRPRRTAPAPLQPARRGRGDPPVRGRRRARLGGARRERDPRPGALGVGGRAGRGWRQGHAEPAVPPRRRDRQAGPHRDVDRPVHRVGQPRRGRDGHRATRCSLAGRRVLVVGAGEMGEGIAVALVQRRGHRHRRHQPHAETRRPRSPSASAAGRAVRRAADGAGRGRRAAHLHRRRAPSSIDVDLVAAAVAPASTAPLLVVDIAVPRNVDTPRSTQLAGVTLLDLDDLRDWAAKGIAAAQPEAAAGARDRRRGGRALRLEATARQAAPLVVAAARAGRSGAPGRARTVRANGSRRSTPAQRAAVEAVTKGIVAKLLHQPSVRVEGRRRHAAGRAQRRRGAATCSTSG